MKTSAWMPVVVLGLAFGAYADRIVPSVARTAGRNNAFFLTDARFLNTSKSDTLTVGVTFYPPGGQPVTEEFTVGPREQVAYDNVVESLFGITDDVTGLLRVAAADSLEVSTRTFNLNDPCTGGTLGTWIPGLLDSEALTAGIIPQAAGSSDPSVGYRTNVIVSNPGDQAASVTLYLKNGDGSSIGTANVVVMTDEAFLGDIFTLVGSSTTETNAFIELVSDQPVLAISSVVDNLTNDSAVFVARSVEPPDPDTLVQVGDKATFSGPYGVSGTAEIVSPTRVRLTNFRADGTAPGMDIRFGKSGASRKEFTVVRVLGRQSYTGTTLDLDLPSGLDLDSFDTITIFCYEFDVVITEGMFKR